MSENPPPLTAIIVRQLLSYAPDTGLFTWRVNKGRAKAGEIAGTLATPPRASQPYRYIKIGQKRYAAHRLAWLHMTGAWPARDIDHINAVGIDNSWLNLRLATGSQNQANSPLQRNNTTGFKGVTRLKDGGYQAQICFHGKYKYLGRYKTPEDAHKAYCAAAREFFGEFARAA